MACAGLASSRPCRQRRVVRRLRRFASPRLKFGDARQQRLVLREQLVDARCEPPDLPQQPQHQRLYVISERIDLLRRHASLNQLAWKISTHYTRVILPRRGESLPTLSIWTVSALATPTDSASPIAEFFRHLKPRNPN